MLKSLRSKVLAILSLMMAVSLTGVGISFWMTQQVNVRLHEINFRSVPLQKELSQLSSDTEMLKREMERSLGFVYWKDPRWKPRRVPVWALEVHRSTLTRFKKSYFQTSAWNDWYARLLKMNDQLGSSAETLYLKLINAEWDAAAALYPDWTQSITQLQKEVEWGRREIDRETRSAFQAAQDDVKNLRVALQLLLLVVIGVSLLMVWMGERALRPIGLLRKIVHSITERGQLTALDKAGLPEISVSKNDEVADLAREFHQMATSLLEREKTVQFQKERLEEQNRRLTQAEHLAAVGRMSAQVAHEVGNPLHSIGLEAELALEVLLNLSNRETMTASQATSQSKDQIQLKQSLNTILDSVERLKKIIQNYLRLSKLTPDQQSPVDFKSVVETVLATYANSIQSQSVRINWIFDDSVWVKADSDLLEYAIGNLLRNSLQALENTAPGRQPRIDIQLKRTPENRVRMLFSDNGPGMSDEAKSGCFKPFFTTKAQGTGLGLSFVKKVFEDLGGTFNLGSTEVNVGTVFVGLLPLLEVSKSKNPEVLNEKRPHETEYGGAG
jgi:two-component system NtrC family sensor kinase